MSVIFFSDTDWVTLRDSFAHYIVNCEHSFRESLPFSFDKSLLSDLTKLGKLTPQEAKISVLTWFVKKLAIANQCAFYYTYPTEQPLLSIPKFPDCSLKNVLSKKELFRKLSSVEYNCYDNNGNNFLPKTVDEQLRSLMLSIASSYFLGD